MKLKVIPLDKTLTQTLFQCPLCGDEFTYLTEAEDCIHNHIHSWCLVSSELGDTIEFGENTTSIMDVKDILINKIKLVVYKVDQYGRRGDIVYETTIKTE